MKWRASYSFFLVAALCFALATMSPLVSWLGGPMLFAFTTLFLVFLIVGAVEFKREDLAREGGRRRR